MVRRYYEAINRGNAEAAAAEFAEDAKNFGRTVGRKGIQDRLVDIFRTFPDWKMEILEASLQAMLWFSFSSERNSSRCKHNAVEWIAGGHAPTGSGSK